ncbi:MAG: undecaprenyldiphospho-muramoylpentapeptide beta-N-acetylglucosaminyltransferase [Bacteroidota bacterium]
MTPRSTQTPRAPRRHRVLFAGGGTGGHVYPAIAIAEAVRDHVPGTTVSFAGTQDRLEWTAVPKAGYPIHPITVTGFPRSLSPKLFTFPLKLTKGLRQSLDLVRSFDPDVVVGTGGYVSGPVLWAASRLGRPIVIQEQNAYAGLTNKLLAKRATRIHVAFEAAIEAFGRPEVCVMSGNPTRPALQTATRAAGRKHFDLPHDAEVLFMFGGSLGSQALNEAMQVHAPRLLERENRYLIWQTGRRYFERLDTPETHHPRLRLLKYVDRMDLAYKAADLTLCRAGAISCSELMVTGTPSVLVPSPNVTADHQTKNARAMVGGGASVLLVEPGLNATLGATIDALFADPSRLAAMSAAALGMARPNASADIAADVLSLAAGYAETNRRTA